MFIMFFKKVTYVTRITVSSQQSSVYIRKNDLYHFCTTFNFYSTKKIDACIFAI